MRHKHLLVIIIFKMVKVKLVLKYKVRREIELLQVYMHRYSFYTIVSLLLHFQRHEKRELLNEIIANSRNFSTIVKLTKYLNITNYCYHPLVIYLYFLFVRVTCNKSTFICSKSTVKTLEQCEICSKLTIKTPVRGL